MHFNYNDKEYFCSFELTIDLISGKWKGLVIWHLKDGTLRYGEIRKRLGKVTQKMLTQTLRDLERNHLVSRKVYPVVPPKVEYQLTEYGRKLIPIFRQLNQWGYEIGKEHGDVISYEHDAKVMDDLI